MLNAMLVTRREKTEIPLGNDGWFTVYTQLRSSLSIAWPLDLELQWTGGGTYA